MPHLRYSTGFWRCFHFRMYQSSEYTRFLNMLGLHKVLNKKFLDRCLAVFWICLGFWICHGSKYTRVTQGCEFFHHRYLTGFLICLEFSIYQFYTGFCIKQPVIHVWQVSEYSSGSYYTRAWIYKGCECAKIPCKLYFKDSQCFDCLELWIC